MLFSADGRGHQTISRTNSESDGWSRRHVACSARPGGPGPALCVLRWRSGRTVSRRRRSAVGAQRQAGGSDLVPELHAAAGPRGAAQRGLTLASLVSSRPSHSPSSTISARLLWKGDPEFLGKRSICWQGSVCKYESQKCKVYLTPQFLIDFSTEVWTAFPVTLSGKPFKVLYDFYFIFIVSLNQDFPSSHKECSLTYYIMHHNLCLVFTWPTLDS